MKKKINDSKKSKYIFVTLCIGCCALVILSLASDMSVGPLKYVSGYVITPIQKGLNEVGNWISDKGVYLQSNVDYAAQCKELQEKVDQLTAEKHGATCRPGRERTPGKAAGTQRPVRLR